MSKLTIDQLATNIDKKFDKMDQRFDEVLSAMSSYANETNSRLSELEASHQRLLNTVDGFVSRIDTYETELVARDHEIARLKRQIQEIADKTGVKLSN